MTRLTLNDELRKTLESVHACIELCDANGKTICYFTPASPKGPQPLEPKVSEEELDRRETEPETFSTAEVKAHLENL